MAAKCWSWYVSDLFFRFIPRAERTLAKYIVCVFINNNIVNCLSFVDLVDLVAYCEGTGWMLGMSYQRRRRARVPLKWPRYYIVTM